MTPVSIIVPVYNERGAIADTVRRLALVLEGLAPGSHVFFVDDGSRDGSSKVLAAAIAESTARDRFILLRHRRNRGYGAALKTGIAHARHDLIAITDADGTYPTEALPEMLEQHHRDEASMTVGVRPPSQQPMERRPAKAVLRAVAQFLTGEKIPDLNSGLRIFRKEDAIRFRHLLPDGFSFTTTITMALLCEGAVVSWFPIRYEVRTGSSKIRPIRDTAGFLLLILRTIVAFNPLKFFGPAAGAFMLAGALLLLVRMVLAEPIGLATTIACFVTGTNLLAVGLLADLVNRRRG